MNSEHKLFLVLAGDPRNLLNDPEPSLRITALYSLIVSPTRPNTSDTTDAEDSVIIKQISIYFEY